MTKPILLSRAVATATAALGACLLATASPAAAFDPTSKSGSENTPLNLGSSAGTSHSTTSSGGASIVRTIVGLAIVLAVIWGLAWIMRQVKAGRDPNVSSAGLASVAALTLGSGRSVHLVRAGNDYVLLGSTEHGVAPIHRYTEEQAREAGLLLASQSPASSPKGQRSWLAAAASQLLVPRSATQETEHSPVAGERPDPMRMSSPSSGLVERLRELTVRR
jgi:flagellar protein FliO/FliZ